MLPRHFQRLKGFQFGLVEGFKSDFRVRIVAAADDGELLMLERLSSLLRTDLAHAQQQVQQELAGMPA